MSISGATLATCTAGYLQAQQERLRCESLTSGEADRIHARCFCVLDYIKFVNDKLPAGSNEVCKMNLDTFNVNETIACEEYEAKLEDDNNLVHRETLKEMLMERYDLLGYVLGSVLLLFLLAFIFQKPLGRGLKVLHDMIQRAWDPVFSNAVWCQ